MPETIPLRPSDLLIDEENPRLADPNVGQCGGNLIMSELFAENG
jgi:hypothetical protein